MVQLQMRIIFIAGIISFFFTGVMAQTPVSPDSVVKQYSIGEVVISAPYGRFATGEDIAAIYPISAGQLQQTQARSTPEALQEQTGVWVQKTNHGGGSPIIRGLTGYQTLLLIDGIRLNNATFRSGPNQYLNTVDVWSLERIDVYHGAGSVQYGSDAIGGVIALYSHVPSFEDTKRMRIRGGIWGQWCSSGMEQTGRGEVSLANNRLALYVGADMKNFGDIRIGSGICPPTGYKEEAMDGKVLWKVSPDLTLTAAFQHLAQHDVPLYHKLKDGVYERNHFQLQDRNLAYLRSEYTTGRSWLKTVQTTLSFQQQGENRELKKAANGYRTYEADNIRSLGISLDMKSSIAFFWQAHTGVDFYNDYVNSSAYDENLSTQYLSYKRGLYPDGSNAAQLSVFTLHEWELQRWKFTGGVRYAIHRMSMQDTIFGDTKLRPSAWVANAGVCYKLTGHLYWKASASSSFRAPNINDMASFGIADHRYEVPCYNLRPERGFNIETGICYKSGTTDASVVIYRNRMSDMIRNMPSQWNGSDSLAGQKVYCRENVDKANIYGVEVSVNRQLLSCWYLYGNMAYTFGESMPDKEPLRRIPPLFGMAGLRYSRHRLDVRAEWQAAAHQSRLSTDDRADERIPENGTPGWNLLNLHATYHQSWYQISCTLGNVFDYAYRMHGSGVDGYGRYLKITARILINRI